MPSEIGRALEGLGSSIGQIPGIPKETDGPRHRVDMGVALAVERESDEQRRATSSVVADAIASAQAADPTSHHRPSPGVTADPSDPAEGEGPRAT